MRATQTRAGSPDSAIHLGSGGRWHRDVKLEDDKAGGPEIDFITDMMLNYELEEDLDRVRKGLPNISCYRDSYPD